MAQGLFIYTQGETIRVGSSDLVIDGRWLRNQEFLVCEISEKGYEYKIIKVKSLYQRPYEYAYFFEKDEFKDDIPFKDRVGEIGENYLKDNVELDYNALKTASIFSDLIYFLILHCMVRRIL